MFVTKTKRSVSRASQNVALLCGHHRGLFSYVQEKKSSAFSTPPSVKGWGELMLLCPPWTNLATDSFSLQNTECRIGDTSPNSETDSHQNVSPSFNKNPLNRKLGVGLPFAAVSMALFF